MLRNSQRLLKLINQLLDLSRFDSGKMNLKAAYHNIVPFLQGILSIFQLIAQENQLKLEFHAERNDISLYYDPPKMEEVMYNLLINAVKFTPSGGKITVSVSINDSQKEKIPEQEEVVTSIVKYVVLSVRDSGEGISKEQLPHIFDRFFQARDLQGNYRKGSGIGLALTK